LSNVFADAFANATNVPVELYNCDGSVGAAIGAGLGAGIYASPKDAFTKFKKEQIIEPTQAALYNELYGKWREKF
jgi:xylulokinase